MARRILIVDDNETLAESLAELLARRGFEALAVCNVEAAQDHLEGGNIDLLLLDVDLGGESGATFLKRLWNSGFSLPTVLITAHTASQMREELTAQRDQHVDILEKPISVTALLEIMEQMLASAMASRARDGAAPRLLLSFTIEARLALTSPQEAPLLGPAHPLPRKGKRR